MNFKIKLPMFHSFVHVFFNETFEESKKEFHSKYKITFHEVEHLSALCYHSSDEWSEHPQMISILLQNNSQLRKDIVHETVHAVSFLCKQTGIISDKLNDEFNAYMTAYICEEINSKLYGKCPPVLASPVLLTKSKSEKVQTEQ